MPCRRRTISINQGLGFTRDADRNIKGLRICMRVDLPKIVPPFILRRLRCFKCFRIMGSNRREDVCIKG